MSTSSEKTASQTPLDMSSPNEKDVEAQQEQQPAQDASGGMNGSNGAIQKEFSNGFWDKELAGMRKAYLIGIARVTFLVALLIWCVVTIYWGSLWKSNEKSPNLTGHIINRDTGAIGTNLTNAFLASNQAPTPHITWISVSPDRYPTLESVEHGVGIDQDAWIFVVIMQDATSALATAQTNADASWNSSAVVQMYYSEARNQQAVDGVVLGSARGVLTSAMASINQALAAQYLIANAANAAAITAIANNAPQTLSGPVASSALNLRPWSHSVAIAPTYVGLIYAMILAFNITMANFALRQGIQRKLRFRSLVMMRIFVPMTSYIFISLMFSMINIPFKLPFESMGLTSDPYGAGFMVWWCFTFLGMTVLGLCTEAFISLVGPPFIGFALVFFIIINVSVANLPIEQQVSFYTYGYAMPFHQLREAYIIIIYNVGKKIDLLKYMGILLAWLAVLFMTLPIWIYRERRTALKTKGGSPGGPPH